MEWWPLTIRCDTSSEVTHVVWKSSAYGRISGASLDTMRLQKVFLLLISFVVASVFVLILWMSPHNESFASFQAVAEKGGKDDFGHRQSSQRERPAPHNALQRVKRERNGYVLTLDYTGQQSAGVRGILSQQCWIASFKLPLRIVEPLCSDSRLVNRAELWHNLSESRRLQLRFSDFFDLEHFNELSRNVGSPLLGTWEEFLERAPRRIIAVTINNVHHTDCLRYPLKTCKAAKVERQPRDTEVTGNCRTERRTEGAVEVLQRLGFEVVRNVCLNCANGIPTQGHQFPPDSVTKHIFGDLSPSEVSVVFNQWKYAISMAPNCEPPPKCLNIFNALSERTISSQRLQQHAMDYIHQMRLPRSSEILALMIRLEWYIMMDQHLKQGVHECLDQVGPLVSKLKSERPKLRLDKPILAMDVGRYGSSTWPLTFKKHNISQRQYAGFLRDIGNTVHRVSKNNHWKLEDWELTFAKVTGGIEDKGYIASLQSAVVSKADCLVLMGGGSFQQLALKHYVETHKDPKQHCVHFVCMSANWVKDFTSILGQS